MRRLCFGLIRSVLIVVNLLVTVLAALLIYVSFTAFKENYHLDSFGNDSQPRLIHTYVSILCAGFGLIIALLSFLGLVGSIKKSKSILATYAAIVFLMVLILTVLVLITYNLQNSSSNNLYREIDKSLVNSTVVVYNHVDSSDMKTKFIDSLQRSLSCCGVNSPNDWTEFSLQKIPKSCCSEPVESTLPVFKYCTESDHKIGCWKAVVDYFHTNLAIVRTLLCIFIAFGLICVTAAGFLILTLKNSLDVV